MSKHNALMISIATGVAILASPASSQDGGRKLQASLTGAAEVPGPGDPDGSGSAALTVNPGQNRICYTLTVRDIEPARAAHIHEGGPTVAGPIVVSLAAPANGSIEGCATVTRELALEILKDPADYYVNVHNAPFPGGAVRGQLGK